MPVIIRLILINSIAGSLIRLLQHFTWFGIKLRNNGNRILKCDFIKSRLPF